MDVIEMNLKGVLVFSFKKYDDERGYFCDYYNQQELTKYGIPSFVQQSQSFSKKGVIRGLHFRKPPYAQAKLVRVVQGTILDIIVDLRKNSPTYKKHLALRLSASDFKQVFIPEGFAHGFSVLSKNAIVSYQLDKYYDPLLECGIRYNDPKLAIDWKVEKPLLSDKDKKLPLLEELDDIF